MLTISVATTQVPSTWKIFDRHLLMAKFMPLWNSQHFDGTSDLYWNEYEAEKTRELIVHLQCAGGVFEVSVMCSDAVW